MSVNSRINQIRLALGFTQAKFAERIAVSASFLAAMARGDKPVNDRVIRLVALEFGISEHWIRTGEGEMYNEQEEIDVAKIIHRQPPVVLTRRRYFPRRFLPCFLCFERLFYSKSCIFPPNIGVKTPIFYMNMREIMKIYVVCPKSLHKKKPRTYPRLWKFVDYCWFVRNFSTSARGLLNALAICSEDNPVSNKLFISSFFSSSIALLIADNSL